jgi:hypothetical protein
VEIPVEPPPMEVLEAKTTLQKSKSVPSLNTQVERVEVSEVVAPR